MGANTWGISMLRVDCEAMISAICIQPGISLDAQKVLILCSKEPNMFVELANQLKQQVVWIRVPTSICRYA